MPEPERRVRAKAKGGVQMRLLAIMALVVGLSSPGWAGGPEETVGQRYSDGTQRCTLAPRFSPVATRSGTKVGDAEHHTAAYTVEEYQTACTPMDQALEQFTQR